MWGAPRAAAEGLSRARRLWEDNAVKLPVVAKDSVHGSISTAGWQLRCFYGHTQGTLARFAGGHSYMDAWVRKWPSSRV